MLRRARKCNPARAVVAIVAEVVADYSVLPLTNLIIVILYGPIG